MHKNIFIFIFISMLSSSLYAQQAIIQLDSDDTLPIASTRFDDAIEPPKDNFSSIDKNDSWERFERGELNQKAFIKLQEQYQAQLNQSKDPYIKRKIKRREIASMKKAKIKAKREAQKQAKTKVSQKTKSKPSAVAVKKKTTKRMPASVKKHSKPKRPTKTKHHIQKTSVKKK